MLVVQGRVLALLDVQPTLKVFDLGYFLQQTCMEFLVLVEECVYFVLELLYADTLS